MSLIHKRGILTQRNFDRLIDCIPVVHQTVEKFFNQNISILTNLSIPSSLSVSHSWTKSLTQRNYNRQHVCGNSACQKVYKSKSFILTNLFALFSMSPRHEQHHRRSEAKIYWLTTCLWSISLSRSSLIPGSRSIVHINLDTKFMVLLLNMRLFMILRCARVRWNR